jgi:hypothetical protein
MLCCLTCCHVSRYVDLHANNIFVFCVLHYSFSQHFLNFFVFFALPFLLLTYFSYFHYRFYITLTFYYLSSFLLPPLFLFIHNYWFIYLIPSFNGIYFSLPSFHCLLFPFLLLFATNVVVEWLTLLVRIREVKGSNPGPSTGYPNAFSWSFLPRTVP